jgi:hypothetical protein
MLAELLAVLTLGLLAVGLYYAAPTALLCTIALAAALVPLAQRVPERLSWAWQTQRRAQPRYSDNKRA